MALLRRSTGPVLLLLSLVLTPACSPSSVEPDGSRPAEAGPDSTPADLLPDRTGDAIADGGPVDMAPGDLPVDGGDGGDAGLRVTVLSEKTLDSGVHYELLKLEAPGKAASYAQWVPPLSGNRRPVVVLTQPYDGIDWTGEKLDMRWAAQGPGAFPDVDGPDFDPATSSNIGYQPLTPETAATNTFLFNVHDVGVLLLYGRFYAGGDVQNDIDDMTVGFDYLALSDLVDRERIGILGGSWGGFEALYGAAYARPDLRPTVGVGLTPLSDFEVEVDYVTRVLPERYTMASSRQASATFFEPYLRRIGAAVEARGGSYAGLTGQDIAERNTTDFLLIHEDWDTLVSFEQSTRLVELAPERFAPLWLLHTTPPDPWDTLLSSHGQLVALHASPVFTFAWAFLLVPLTGGDPQTIVPWDGVPFRSFLTYFRQLQEGGLDVDFLAARLRQLTGPTVKLYDVTSMAQTAGAATIAAEVNAVWGTSFTAETIADGLADGLPPAAGP